MTRPVSEVSDDFVARVIDLYTVEEMAIRTIAEKMAVGHKRVVKILVDHQIPRRTSAQSQQLVARRLVEKMAADSSVAARVREWGASAATLNSDFRVLREWPAGFTFTDDPRASSAADSRGSMRDIPRCAPASYMGCASRMLIGE